MYRYSTIDVELLNITNKPERRKRSMKLLTTEQLGRTLQLSRQTIERYRYRGMPYMETGSGRYRYDLDEVLKWMKRNASSRMKGA